jgi:hypothetical protein
MIYERDNRRRGVDPGVETEEVARFSGPRDNTQNSKTDQSEERQGGNCDKCKTNDSTNR